MVELADFGKRCEALADLAGQSVAELGGSTEADCAQRVAEEIELACRVAAWLETLPKSPQRLDRQCRPLEEALDAVDAALAAECALEEPASVSSLSVLARRERERR